MSTKALNYLAPINPLGYGVVGLNLFMALTQAGVDIKLWPIGQVDAAPSYVPFLQEAIDNRHRYNIKAPSLRVWHQHDLAQHVGRGCHIGYPIFELTEFTDVEQGEVEAMDHVFVCSDWAKKIVLDQCPLISDGYVTVVPCGVDRGIFE